MLFVDFAKAFDSISRESIIENLQAQAIEPALVHFIASLLSYTTAKVDDTHIQTNVGCQQGSNLGPALWNTAVMSLIEILCNHENKYSAYREYFYGAVKSLLQITSKPSVEMLLHFSLGTSFDSYARARIQAQRDVLNGMPASKKDRQIL